MERWVGRRSPIFGLKGICASSQPLATAIGVKILQQGGNAADAAVAMAAALNVTEPCSTGLGGDAFALYYQASSKEVFCLQGNGASASSLSLDILHQQGITHQLPPRSGLCVTVPGAAALWDDLVHVHGQLTLDQVLQPAIELAERGFPVSPVTAHAWSDSFLQGEEAKRVFKSTIKPGEIFTNPDLANTFRRLGSLGAHKGFYQGPIAEAIVNAVKQYDGLLSLDDLAQHKTTFNKAISTIYKGLHIYQTPPPSHGLSVLLALNIISNYEEEHGKVDISKGRYHSSNSHLSIEAMRRGFADALHYLGDPSHSSVPLDYLLSTEYAKKRANEINSSLATPVHPITIDNNTIESSSYSSTLEAYQTGETVYFSVIDEAGNACSMINSNYQGFGSGIVPIGTGFSLQNRGANFNLLINHPNCVAGNKKPYHTIIPGLATYVKDNSLYAVFGNMGGFMQPMGHLQLIRGLVDFKEDPQEAVDASRWYLSTAGHSQSSADVFSSEILLEDGYHAQDENTQRILSEMGHKVGEDFIKGNDRLLFGKAQVILHDHISGISCAGSDPRSDGCAMPVV
eukprot:gene6849-7570_t